MDAELKELLVDIRGEINGLRQELHTTTDGLRQEFQFHMTAEALRHEIGLVSERVISNGEKIDALDTKVERITSDLSDRVTRLEALSARRLRTQRSR